MKRLIKKTKNERRQVRHARIRTRVKGTAKIPRVSVFRGLKNISLQLIDDVSGRTICQASSLELLKKDGADIKKEKVEGKTTKVADAFLAGKLLAKRAIENKISSVVFDRGGYKFHGRVAAVAEGLTTGGLKI